MKKASKYFSEDNLKSIEAVIAQAELNTSGEIVPVVASVSGQYDRAEDVFGLLFGLLLLSAVWLGTEETISIDGQWEKDKIATLTLPYVLILVFLGFIVGTILATFFPVLRLIFISKQEMQEQVQGKAAEAFHHFRIRNTKDATGVLIYVSLYEHMVRVMGDDRISEKLTQANWDEVCSAVVEGMKNGNPHEGLEKAIEKSGQLLSEHFPIAENDKNELPNRLQLID